MFALVIHICGIHIVANIITAVYGIVIDIIIVIIIDGIVHGCHCENG